jgi:hypothetical protein
MSKLQGLCCLLLAQHSVAQQLSRPFALGESVVGPAGGEQFSPAVAWTGSEYFVVWSDLRVLVLTSLGQLRPEFLTSIPHPLTGFLTRIPHPTSA